MVTKIRILLLPLLLCAVQGSAEKLEPELPFEGDLLADVSEQATPTTKPPTPTKPPTAKKTPSKPSTAKKTPSTPSTAKKTSGSACKTVAMRGSLDKAQTCKLLEDAGYPNCDVDLSKVPDGVKAAARRMADGFKKAAKLCAAPSTKTFAPTANPNSWACVANRECKPKNGKTKYTGSMVQSTDNKIWTEDGNTLAKCKAWGKSLSTTWGKGGLLIVWRDKKCSVYKGKPSTHTNGQAKCPFGERKVPASSGGTTLCTFTPAKEKKSTPVNTPAKEKSTPVKALEAKKADKSGAAVHGASLAGAVLVGALLMQ